MQSSGEEGIVRRIQERRERIHVSIAPSCNNNCIFCMEEDREKRRQMNSALAPDRVSGLLEANVGREEVCFTSGEPTLVRELPTYCSWARFLGYERISVMTNGRRLSYAPYLAALVKAGANRFYISIHGHTARLHDGLVRTPGAFAQTVMGLGNVARLKDAGVSLHTSTVVNKRNYGFIGAIYDFLCERLVDQVVFNVMQPKGRANTHFLRIYPRYTDVVAQYLTFIKSCQDPRPHAFLVDIPLCLAEQIPDHNRGYVEKSVVHFAETTSEVLQEGATHARDQHVEVLRVTRADLDAEERMKRKECATCRYDAVCEGVWRNYTAHFGWDEFVPVSEPGV